MPIVDLPGDVRLGYRIDGPESTPPLLLLRPVGGSIAMWGAFREELAGERRVIAIDHRGSGPSSAAKLGLTTRTIAKDMLAALDALGFASGPIDVFGVSLGGMVATRLAADHPDRVRRLILASTPVRGLDTQPMHAMSATMRGLSLARCLTRSSEDLLPCLVAELMSPNFRDGQPEEARRVIAAARREHTTRFGIAALLAAALRHDASHDLGRIRARTLVMVGEHDPLLTVDSQRQLMREIATAEFDVIRAAGHAVALEQPHEVAKRVLAFLAGD